MSTFHRAHVVWVPVAALALASLPLAVATSKAAEDGAGLAPNDLRCESKDSPLGIDVASPRLSWIVESSRRGQKQTAYRLIVASEGRLLGQERADLWDSGKVESDETVGVAYAGKPLASHQRCFWRVRVWDKDGKPSGWSKTAIWSMGLLKPTDWKADWVGYTSPDRLSCPTPRSSGPAGSSPGAGSSTPPSS